MYSRLGDNDKVLAMILCLRDKDHWYVSKWYVSKLWMSRNKQDVEYLSLVIMCHVFIKIMEIYTGFFTELQPAKVDYHACNSIRREILNGSNILINFIQEWWESWSVI